VTMVPHGSSNVSQVKRALREQMRERRLRLSADEGRAASTAACARLLALLGARDDLAGKVVAAYVAVRGELDPAPAFDGLRSAGARIALPLSDAPAAGGTPLRFVCVEADAALRPGRFGIPEPEEGARVSVLPAALEIVIVPGLAFDAEGRRLGSGAGYYDGTFEGRRPDGPPILIGFAHDFQIVDRCPAEAHDVSVDWVVTESRVIGPGPSTKEGGRR